MPRELSFFRARVHGLTVLTPHLRRLVVSGAGAAGWRASGAPDEALLLVLPGPDGLVLPDETEHDPYGCSRWYTVRRYDSATDLLTVDIAVHPGGVSTEWARSVAPRDPIGISTVCSWWRRPADARWQVLVGDLTALPTIRRVLEEHGDGLPTRAVVEVPGAADEQPYAGLTWVHTPPGRPSRLAALVRALELPDCRGYVYVAGEAGAARAARRHLRHERLLPASAYSVNGYWRAGSQEWMRRYLAVEHELGLADLYARFEVPGADKEALNDEVDRRLDAAGL